jgi:hypothetical protein
VQLGGLAPPRPVVGSAPILAGREDMARAHQSKPLFLVHDMDAVPFARRFGGKGVAALAHRFRGEVLGA